MLFAFDPTANLCMESIGWKISSCIRLAPSPYRKRCLKSCTTVREYSFVSPSRSTVRLLIFSYWHTVK